MLFTVVQIRDKPDSETEFDVTQLYQLSDNRWSIDRVSASLFPSEGSTQKKYE